jgi:hypothetical protein
MRNVLIVGAFALLLVGCGQTAEVKTAEGAEVVPKVEAPPEPPPPAPKAIVIPAGARVSVRTTTALSSNTVSTGETFSGSLNEPILSEGKIVVPKGASVEGLIAESDDGGRVKGVASLSLRLTRIQNGAKWVPVQSSLYTKAAPASKKNDAVKVGIGAGIGAAIGAIAGGGKGAAIGAASGGGAGTAVVLATRGKPAVVGAESVVSFRLTAAVTIAD